MSEIQFGFIKRHAKQWSRCPREKIVTALKVAVDQLVIETLIGNTDVKYITPATL